MTDPNLGSGGLPGSPENGPADNTKGQPGEGTDYKALYEELETKMGGMGNELGEFRSFFEGISPLLTQLDKSPGLVQAIVDGKIDESLAKSVLEGKVTIGDAKAVTEANADVKKELGKRAYDSASPEDIARLIEEKVSEAKQELGKDLKEVEEMRSFEAGVNEFIANTLDFPKYADDVSKWLNDHDDVTDIKVAYYAVKGELSEREAKKQAEIDAAEYQKGQSPRGGQSGSRTLPSGSNAVDQLIGGRSNPNVF